MNIPIKASISKNFFSLMSNSDFLTLLYLEIFSVNSIFLILVNFKSPRLTKVYTV
jgi:hypothetical protein